MKKIIISAITVLSLAALILSGCSSKKETSGVVTTDGSTSMEKVIGYLSEAYM